MFIKYCGPALDYSGYGEAARHDIGALTQAGIQVTTQIPRYCLEISDFGRLGALVAQQQDKEYLYKIKIIHTTPNVYTQFMEQGKYHIGRVFWETDKLPMDFAKSCELMDEIWTGSEFNRRAIEKAGVTKPIYIIPEAIDTEVPLSEPYKTRNNEDFTFYSMFEWTERKNPGALLTAFWQEFEKTEAVSLTIKTYLDNFTPEKREEIFAHANRVKRSLGLTRYAPVYIYTNLMDRYQVYRFHKSFDCFVSAHRGEGWGIPQMEALLMDRPVISTNLGGIHEYLENDVDAKLIPYDMVPLSGNTRNQQWYTADQEWGNVDIPKLREAMRWIFEHKEEAKQMGITGGKKVRSKFGLEPVGMLMAKRLAELQQIYG